MPSQLINNDKISFVCAKPFTYAGIKYEMGEDFPQERANNIETMVRSRFIIPVVEVLQDKPRHWHRHIRPRAEVLERLSRSRKQIEMPGTEVEIKDEVEPTNDHEWVEYSPTEHTVAEVLAYLDKYPEDTERVLALEAANRERKGILERS